jgi:hypothetical protein
MISSYLELLPLLTKHARVLRRSPHAPKLFEVDEQIDLTKEGLDSGILEQARIDHDLGH